MPTSSDALQSPVRSGAAGLASPAAGPSPERRDPRTSAIPALRIFVDSGDYRHLNVGDMAMLQVSLRRLASLWPTASLEVLTENSERLSRYCPSAHAVSCEGRRQWFSDREPFTRAWTNAPASLGGFARSLKAWLRLRQPGVLTAAHRWSLSRHGLDVAPLENFVGSCYGARAMVVSGAGGITDHAAGWATRILDSLEIGIGRGVPTALFGHGLGPLTRPALVKRARSVLSRVSLLALREGRFGPQLARELGVDPSRIVVTGDDAVELGVEGASQTPGTALGVNLRLSPSSGIGSETLDAIREALGAFIRFRQPRLLPIPIAFNEQLDAGKRLYADMRSIRLLLEGLVDLVEPDDPLDTPEAVIRQIGKTRVVLTGAYHAAVFALAQGIPVVCLAGTTYFAQKFEGLKFQFGLGCEVVRVDAAGFGETLTSALAEAWEVADDVRAPLRAAAKLQVEASREAYLRFAKLLPEVRA